MYERERGDLHEANHDSQAIWRSIVKELSRQIFFHVVATSILIKRQFHPVAGRHAPQRVDLPCVGE